MGAGTLMMGVLLVVVLLMVGWLLFGGGDRGGETNIDVDLPSTEAPEVDVPEKVDVEVKTGSE